MAAPPKQYGTTPPINTNPPTKEDNERNQELIQELKNQNCFESPEESQKRIVVLGILQTLAENFVRKTCIMKGLPEHMVNNSGGKIFTFGSYRLGAYGPGSDIDTLLVAPAHVHRENFFALVPGMLAELNPPAQEVSPVPDAFMPIIKFELQDISIDLIFARIPSLTSIPRDMTLENKDLLKGCDEPNLRGLNGVRLTDELLALVPHPGNFRMALRAIKLWAKSRGIYANVIGFPGGIAWAMLVAKICQLYPMAVSGTIVAKFFIIYTKWKWPQPVLLKDILEDGGTQNGGFPVWNPKIYRADRSHLMPVITPNYPSMCATHNITRSTKAVILREMARAQGIVTDIVMKKATWDKLFEPQTFFTKDYKYYLRVIAAARSKEESLKWSGLVESKVRHFVGKLEQVVNIELAHPFNKPFDEDIVCADDDEAYRAARGQKISPKPDGEQEENEKTTVYTTNHYIGLVIDANKGRHIDVSWACDEFYDICKGWPLYDEDNHSIHVIQHRAWDLPDHVFKPGEQRPVRQVKKVIVKRKVATATGAKKRGVDDDIIADAKRQRTGTSTPAAVPPASA